MQSHLLSSQRTIDELMLERDECAHEGVAILLGNRQVFHIQVGSDSSERLRMTSG